MAKDAKGHGSEKRGAAAEVGELGSQHSSNATTGNKFTGLQSRGASPEVGELGSAHSSNSGEAHVASIAARHGVPTGHLDSWRPSGTDTLNGHQRSDDYDRDLALRARNGQVGSGMKFRG